MAYKMKPLPHGVTLEALFNHKSAVYRQLSRIFFSGREASAKELAQQIPMTIDSIWLALKAFKASGLIYISKWLLPDGQRTTPTPVYRAGNKLDAPKPEPKTKDIAERSKKYREAKKQVEECPYAWQGIHEALVPKRTEEEIREVNWGYLCYISPDAVKYAM